MPERVTPLVSCVARPDPKIAESVSFNKIICLVHRGPRKLIAVYAIGQHGQIIPGPIEYHVEDLAKDFPRLTYLCIDAGGRNHGLNTPVFINAHDVNNALIEASKHLQSLDLSRDM